jgi:two-component system, NtrC family, sensor kinase
MTGAALSVEDKFMLDEAFSDATIDRCEERDNVKSRRVQLHRWEMVGQLTAGIAHEINTPTQYIGDNLRFLRDAFADLRPLLSACLTLLDGRGGLSGGDAASGGTLVMLNAGKTSAALDASEFLLGEIPAAIDQSLEGIDRVAQMARSMRDFAHSDHGQRHAVDLNRIVEAALTISRNEWKYVAEATTDLDLGLPLVRCVPGEMNQMLLNLIVNAAHAVAAGLGCRADGREAGAAKGSIAVRTRQDGDWVQIEVEDTGAGIPEAIRDKVFERFFTTKAPGHGTGQGLAIVRDIVEERHRGTICFDTKAGRGTKFTVRIPINPDLSLGKGDGDEEGNLVRG